ncbi:unnamed protein product [Danaus chrysippus]|uniref:(African queen) hypothetical protein n=1 Tax=Danaus chrysippus TaxID=151541 RepID=A0A8J2W932_9NEOP|nr:unnamed protein product [Danaus chrysippus]
MNYRLGSIVHSPSGCSLCGSNQASAREGCELEGCANLARAAPEPRVDTGGRGAAPPAPRAAALSPPLAPPDPPPRRMRNVNRYQCASALVYRCTTTTITTTKEEVRKRHLKISSVQIDGLSLKRSVGGERIVEGQGPRV